MGQVIHGTMAQFINILMGEIMDIEIMVFNYSGAPVLYTCKDSDDMKKQIHRYFRRGNVQEIDIYICNKLFKRVDQYSLEEL